MRPKAFQTVAAGDQVVVVGTFSAAVLTVGPTLAASNSVLDVGPPKPMHGDRGEF